MEFLCTIVFNLILIKDEHYIFLKVENFILRMAAEFPQRKEQLVFLINNYDMMLSVLMVCSSIILTLCCMMFMFLTNIPAVWDTVHSPFFGNVHLIYYNDTIFNNKPTSFEQGCIHDDNLFNFKVLTPFFTSCT